MSLHVLVMIVMAEKGRVFCRETSPLRTSVQKHLEQIRISSENILNRSNDDGSLAGIWINQFHRSPELENHDVVGIRALEHNSA
ncbi:MAG: hypothetical protein ABSE90_09955 [Verrucomicrobiota bacterium]